MALTPEMGHFTDPMTRNLSSMVSGRDQQAVDNVVSVRAFIDLWFSVQDGVGACL